MVKKLSLILLAAMSLSCGKLEVVNMFLPLSADVNSRVEESLAWNASAGVRTISVDTEDYSWYVCSDIHVDSEKPSRFAAMVSAANHSGAFYQMLGDILYGSEHLDWVSDIMLDTSNVPGFAIAGNHDLFFGGWESWKAAFHSSTYYYFVQTPSERDLYIMLDSANGTLGEVQLAWLEGVLSDVRPACRHCFVSVHTNMFRTDLSQLPSTNFTLEETYRLLDLFSGVVDMVISGHDHYRDITVFDGVTYITLDCIKEDASNASYMVLYTGQSVDYKFVEFK